MRTKIVFVSGSRADFGLIQDTLKVFSDSKQYAVTLMRVGHSLAEENDYLNRITGLKVDRLETTLGVNNILSQREYGLAVGEICILDPPGYPPINPVNCSPKNPYLW